MKRVAIEIKLIDQKELRESEMSEMVASPILLANDFFAGPINVNEKNLY